VARLQEQAMRRLMQLPVARALGAWKAAVDERRQLLRATQRLRQPGLASAFGAWLAVAAEAREAREAAEREALEEARRQAEAARLEDAYERARAVAAREREGLESALEAARREAELAKLEREARARELFEQGCRRLLNARLAQAFSTWTDATEEHRRLRRAAAHFLAPGLATLGSGASLRTRRCARGCSWSSRRCR
jgi:hypothetical protein